jgi:hypothetical protein
MSARRQRVERTSTPVGENGRERAGARSFGANRSAADDCGRDLLSKAETATVAAIESGVEALV